MNDELFECGECGEMTETVTKDFDAGTIHYSCSSCGHEGTDDWCDVYGVMSHPSGFLC
jgi:hypothetical protein